MESDRILFLCGQVKKCLTKVHFSFLCYLKQAGILAAGSNPACQNVYMFGEGKSSNV